MNETVSLSSIKVSSESLAIETERLRKHVENIAFTRPSAIGDFDTQQYLIFYNSMRSTAELVPEDLSMVKESFNDLPDVYIEEFNTSSWGWGNNIADLPGVFMLVLIPVSLVIWMNAFDRRQKLIAKLQTIEQKMNSATFLLKAAMN